MEVLPLVAEHAGTPPSGRQRTILVFDDEPGILRGCERVLRAEGHEALLGANARKSIWPS